MMGELLQLEKIEKSFFGVPVLKGVSLQLAHGTTLGLVGENGAGKSTLMNILGGNLRADAGAMSIAGSDYRPANPRDAVKVGIAFIHQELNLFPNLSIAENLFLSQFPQRLGWIDRSAMIRRAEELLHQVGLDLSPKLRVEQVSAGERQMVEIAKALSLNAKLIILDEPTTSLTSRESERLFTLLAALKKQGIAMIYISHALGDVQQLCDQVVVLRDGSVVGGGPIGQFDTSRLVSLMVGRDIEQQFPIRTRREISDTRLEARQLTVSGTLHDISFDLHAGEVLGISGLMGSGRTELARILFGLDAVDSGSLMLAGEYITHLSPRHRIARGMAMLTESRREDGLCLPASIRDNIGLVAAPKYASKYLGVLKGKEFSQSIEKIRKAVQLSPKANIRQSVQTLSGGNQQKVVLAKWLMNSPQVLILDEPTRGIDVGAKFEIYRLIHELAASGSALLVISSEIEELMGICDRILVMSQGEIKDQVARAEFDRERILRAALKSDFSAGVQP
jgi:ribose transport system ATP-binding protein